MIQTFKERLIKLKKTSSVIDVVYGDNDPVVLSDVVVNRVKSDSVKFLKADSGETFTVPLKQIKYVQY